MPRHSVFPSALPNSLTFLEDLKPAAETDLQITQHITARCTPVKSRWVLRTVYDAGLPVVKSKSGEVRNMDSCVCQVQQLEPASCARLLSI